MTEKELISKLNNLKNVNPEQSWLNSNRELLLTQISNAGAGKLSAWRIFLINFNSLAKTASRPAFALGVFALILISGSLFSHQLLVNAKPNDSLYIARIISEKAKLNTMFNSEARNKLAIQFATEHAQDISAVLADPQFNNDSNKDQIAKLNDSFSKEITAAKYSINRLAASNKNQPAVLNSDDNNVLIADSSKDNQGIQTANGIDPNTITNHSTTTNNSMATSTLSYNSTTTAATSTPVKKENDRSTDTNKILDEAQKLFENKDYNKASDKLKEVDELIKVEPLVKN